MRAWLVLAGSLLISGRALATPMFAGLGDLSGGSYFSQAWGVSADGTVVTGDSGSVGGNEAFVWTAETGMVGLGDLPGGASYSGGRALSGDGSTAVGASGSASGLESFRWTAETGSSGIGDLAGGRFSGAAYGVSADGSVVVGQGDSDRGAEAYRWTTAGMIGLELPDGFARSNAQAISADGSTIVGHGINPEGYTEGWIAVVPEPSTALLVAAGLTAMAALRRAGPFTD